MKGEKSEKSIAGALKVLREDIDRIDDGIISLISERLEQARKIGGLKKTSGLETVDPAREAEVIRRMTGHAPAGLSEQSIRIIFRELMGAARGVQLPVEVFFLGPEGTFSHQAALKHFGSQACFRPAGSIGEIFRNVERGDTSRGIVPVENSCEGPVNETMDNLYSHDLKVCSETYLRIRHHLLSEAAKMDEIERIFSHPMAIGQCRAWIRKNLPHARLIETRSTAKAAEKALGDPSAAAIGSMMAALDLNLNIMVSDIEDQPNNFTRFLVVGKTSPRPTGSDKTMVVFSLNHKPGALHGALEPLSARGINMMKIESRPMKRGRWEYLFYVDLEGHQAEPILAETFEEMSQLCIWLKILGSFPKGNV